MTSCSVYNSCAHSHATTAIWRDVNHLAATPGTQWTYGGTYGSRKREGRRDWAFVATLPVALFAGFRQATGMTRE